MNTGMLSGIAALLTVNGGAGSTTTNVGRHGRHRSEHQHADRHDVQSTAFGTGGSLSYSSLATLNMTMGSGGNTFNVANTASPTTTTLNSGRGSDTINVQTHKRTTDREHRRRNRSKHSQRGQSRACGWRLHWPNQGGTELSSAMASTR